MGTIAKKLRLRTDHSSLASKKYLGEPDDPHFIPDSPLIERQMLSEQEEGELKRVCALLLANVPHSDDMSDDPFRYMAAHIQDGKAGQQRKRELPSQPVQNTNSAPTTVSHKPVDTKLDSTTPSDISRLHTLNATDNSTPLTSAGLTPGDSRAALSDATRRSVASTRKSASGLRTEAAARTDRSRKTSFAGRQKSLESDEHSPDLDEVKGTVRLVDDRSPNRGRTSNKSMANNRTAARLSAPDLNKCLPPPPPSPPLRPTESPLPEDPKQPHISRLMKTIRKKKSQVPAEERKVSAASDTGTSTAPIPPIPSAEDRKAAPTAAPFQSSTSPSTQTAPEPAISASASASHGPHPDHPKKRFRLRLFHRLHRPAGVLVT
ncbi:hypothetical protein ABEF95_010034 [Exophiala dermatitidis]